MKEYYYADPTGNITILAPLPAGDVSLTETAAQLMSMEPAAEQVGFLSDGGDEWDISLQMAGGEFCGNATLSAAAVFALTRASFPGNAGTVSVRVNGVETPVPVRLTQTGTDAFTGRVQMPSPLEIRTQVLEWESRSYALPVVRFPGITHILLEIPLEKDLMEAAIRKWCCDLESDALGIMRMDVRNRTLTPLVYVRSGGTLFWERSCASGTTAAGAYLRQKEGPGEWEFTEPAGVLRIQASAEGPLILTGNVKIQKKTSS